jgi:L-aspartate oxidase
MKQADLVVVGAGAAGLWCALEAADMGARVVLVSRKHLLDVSSFWAQGGLAGAVGEDDDARRHIQDTLKAGRGLCKKSAVEQLVSQAPQQLDKLQARGMQFDRSDGKLILGLEGGHSRRRIVHAGGSSTGSHILWWLTSQVAASSVEVWEGVSAWSVLSDGDRAWGVHTDAGDVHAKAIVLATGGAAALWERSSNPPGSIGAGAVLAWEAGASLADVEFCQFHPTALVLEGHRDGFLITEAIRGEGATLHNSQGERFVDELAPRDQVANALLDQMEQDGQGWVYLDMTDIDGQKFPNIVSVLLDVGIDPSKERIPVAPAAHYSMGGIVVDGQAQSRVKGLLAAGECACSGLHGANRLASNSLSECFVWGAQAASHGLSLEASPSGKARLKTFMPPRVQTRQRVWELAGPSRSAHKLEQLLDDPYPLARMIGESALARTESRGGHLREDYPQSSTSWDKTHLIHQQDCKIRTEIW